MRYNNKRGIQFMLFGLYLLSMACIREADPHSKEISVTSDRDRELERLLEETAIILEDSFSATRPLQYLHPRPGRRYDDSYEDEMLWLLYHEPGMPFRRNTGTQDRHRKID